MEIGLLSCTKSKRDKVSKPAELYMESAFFRKAKEYAEVHHNAWYILSAKHHLLHPDGQPIEPYDDTLSGASVKRKREWSHTVCNELQEEGLLTEENRLVFHAGRDYYEELLPLLEGTAIEIDIPTDGLRYGETLSWYKERL
jgi:hypothetical protein